MCLRLYDLLPATHYLLPTVLLHIIYFLYFYLLLSLSICLLFTNLLPHCLLPTTSYLLVGVDMQAEELLPVYLCMRMSVYTCRYAMAAPSGGGLAPLI